MSTDVIPPAPSASFSDNARRIAPLAWPVLVGQLSMLAYGTIDTLLVARSSATDLAALAVGTAAYVTIFIGFMGALMALAPIVGQLEGAGRRVEAGQRMHQAVWLALAMSLIGSLLLLFPEPFLALSRAGPEVAAKVRAYLTALAVALPASLLFAVFRAFNIAIGRPKAVMNLQVAGLAVKVPLSLGLVFGVPVLGIPAFGVLGCGIATALAFWAQAGAAAWLLRRDTAYGPYEIIGRGLARPDGAALRELLRLGVPMGLAIGVEVTGFTFMALFISRLGTTPVAGHQIVVNLVSMMFMVPLAIGNASGTLVAQSIGAGRSGEARRLGWHGLAMGCALAAVMGGVVYAAREPVLGLYTRDAAVVAAALPLVAWLAVFHIADAAQTIAAYVLRAHKIATVPLIIYVTALWGVGLGGGYGLAFDITGTVPVSMQGAPGYWISATAGLVLAGAALVLFMIWMLLRDRGAAQRP